MRACIDMYHQTVTIRNHCKAEVLNLVHDTETWDGSEDELKTESESDIECICINLKRGSVSNR